jgi:hypothetical protein
MNVTTLHEVEESLRSIDHETLREMAYQVARSHIDVCELTSTIGDCAHIEDDEIRDRVDASTVAELASLLAPTAWTSIELHRRLAD